MLLIQVICKNPFCQQQSLDMREGANFCPFCGRKYSEFGVDLEKRWAQAKTGAEYKAKVNEQEVLRRRYRATLDTLNALVAFSIFMILVVAMPRVAVVWAIFFTIWILLASVFTKKMANKKFPLP